MRLFLAALVAGCALFSPVRRAGATHPGSYVSVEAFVKSITPFGTGGPGQLFGSAVDISGGRAVIGAYHEDSGEGGVTMRPTSIPTDSGRPNSGAVFILARLPDGTWEFEAFVKSPLPQAGDEFGYSVGVTKDGRIIVGAPGDDSGAIPNGVLLNPTNATMPAGSQLSASGAAYILEIDAVTGVWDFVAYIKALVPGIVHEFGFDVDMSGTHAIVSAPGESSSVGGIIMNPTNESIASDDDLQESGAAFMLERGSGGWAHSAFVKAVVPLSSLFVGGDRFGHAVGLSGERAIVTSKVNSASEGGVFMNPTNATIPTDDGAEESGGAYVLERDVSSGVWSFTAFIKAPVPGEYDQFGFSADVTGDFAIIGAVDESSSTPGITMNPQNSTQLLDNSLFNSGGAYILRRDPGTGVWIFDALIKSLFPSRFDQFGWSVAISGSRAAIGYWGEDSGVTGVIGFPNLNNDTWPRDDNETSSGAVVALERSFISGKWEYTAFMKNLVRKRDRFGRAVALSGSRLIAGVWFDGSSVGGIINNPNKSNVPTDNGAPSSGAAYITDIDYLPPPITTTGFSQTTLISTTTGRGSSSGGSSSASSSTGAGREAASSSGEETTAGGIIVIIVICASGCFLICFAVCCVIIRRSKSEPLAPPPGTTARRAFEKEVNDEEIELDVGESDETQTESSSSDS